MWLPSNSQSYFRFGWVFCKHITTCTTTNVIQENKHRHEDNSGSYSGKPFVCLGLKRHTRPEGRRRSVLVLLGTFARVNGSDIARPGLCILAGGSVNRGRNVRRPGLCILANKHGSASRAGHAVCVCLTCLDGSSSTASMELLGKLRK